MFTPFYISNADFILNAIQCVIKNIWININGKLFKS